MTDEFFFPWGIENRLPGQFPVPIHLHQGKRLQKQLRRDILRVTLEKRAI